MNKKLYFRKNWV